MPSRYSIIKKKEENVNINFKYNLKESIILKYSETISKIICIIWNVYFRENSLNVFQT